MMILNYINVTVSWHSFKRKREGKVLYCDLSWVLLKMKGIQLKAIEQYIFSMFKTQMSSFNEERSSLM